MGLAVLINGESGAGKSASLRNFNKSEVLVFSHINLDFLLKRISM